jgi:hypothetical protein
MNKFKLLILVVLVMPFCTLMNAKNDKSIIAGYYRSEKRWQQAHPYQKIDSSSYTHILHIGHLRYDPATKKITVPETGFYPNSEMTEYFHEKK